MSRSNFLDFLAGGGLDSDSAMKLNTQKAGKKKEAQNCKLCADSAAHGTHD